MLPLYRSADVTPHAGVRIEIDVLALNKMAAPSPPTRGCELKWRDGRTRTAAGVTPHAGVRIEMGTTDRRRSSARSPPTRGCELKFAQKYSHTDLVVTPHAGVRIEIVLRDFKQRRCQSPPTRGCELKSTASLRSAGTLWSPPTRGCELKFVAETANPIRNVTPHAGVRIEIYLHGSSRHCASHPPRGGAN